MLLNNSCSTSMVGKRLFTSANFFVYMLEVEKTQIMSHRKLAIKASNILLKSQLSKSMCVGLLAIKPWFVFQVKYD